MSRRALNLDRLRVPQPRFDLELVLLPNADPPSKEGTHGFETADATWVEELERVQSLERWLDQGARARGGLIRAPGFSESEAQDLYARLDASLSGSPPQSFASAIYGREFRRRFSGAALDVIDYQQQDFRLVTVTLSQYGVRGSGLGLIDPRMKREQLRSDLNRQNPRGVPGCFISMLHGDYYRRADRWQLHWHVLASVQAAPSFRGLKDRPRLEDLEPSVRQVEVPIKCIEIDNPPRQVSYHVSQLYWPGKYKSQTGKWPRGPRIDDPRHAEWLMWMDRMSFSDLVWLKGIQVSGGGLVLSSP